MKGGSVIFDFEGNDSKLKKSLSSVGDIVKGSLLAKGVMKGFNLVNKNLEKAIKRVDTLNNFPNVMGNLGIGAEDSSEAISKLSQKLVGLPTTLDTAVLAVQRFTSKNNDVKKSADMFLAVNNAILAGGASADIQASALEQISQAYAKGKPDMIEWRSMLTAMPAQVNQVAQAFGTTSDALGEAMRNGDISMDEFIAKIMELNKTGSGQFASFEDQAKASTGGIQTAVTNMKTAVTRGVANMIDTINKSLKENDLPTISEMLVTAGSKISNAFSKVSDVIKAVMPYLANVYKWFDKNKTIILSLGGTLFGLSKTYGVVTKAMEIGGKISKTAGKIGGLAKAFGGLIPQIKSVKDAFTLLGMAFNLNPIGLMVTAIIGLVAGFVILWKKCEAFRNFWIGLWNGIKKVFNAVVDWLKNAGTNIGEFFSKDVPEFFKNGFESAKNVVKNAVKNIAGFFTKTLPEKFKSGFEKIKNVVNSGIQAVGKFFTETLPKLILSGLNKIKNFIQNIPYYIGFIIGYIGGLIVKFGQSVYNFFVVTIPNYLKIAWEFIKSIPSKIMEIISAIWMRIQEFGLLIYNFFTQKIPEYLGIAWEFISGIPAKIWEVIQNVWGKIAEFGGNIRDFFTITITGYLKQAWEFISGIPEKIWGIITNILGKITTWVSNMKTKVKEGIINVKNTIINTLKELPGKVVDIGKNIVEGIWTGIKNAKDWIKKKVKEFCKGVVDGFKNALGIHSPSKEFAIVGKFSMLGYEEGLENMQPEIQKTIDGMFDLSPSLYNNASTNLSPNINVINNVNVEQDPLGQMVNNIKTFAGGSRNDYNYGMGG